MQVIPENNREELLISLPVLEEIPALVMNYDLQGRLLLTKALTLIPGSPAHLSIKILPTGYYAFRLQDSHFGTSKLFRKK